MDAEQWDQRYRDAEMLWSAEPNRFVAEEVAELAPGRALDLAAGEGRNAIWLAARGWDVDAVDFSQVALERGEEIAKKRDIATVHWQRRDLMEWSPEREAYDLVLVAYLHLPWQQMSAVLRRAAAAVAPTGHFLLVGHDEQNLEHGHGGPPDPKVLYGPEQVAAELEGFEVEKAERVRRPVETDDGTVEAIDNVVRAVRRCAT